jgi:hypothetical protein
MGGCLGLLFVIISIGYAVSGKMALRKKDLNML